MPFRRARRRLLDAPRVVLSEALVDALLASPPDIEITCYPLLV